MSTVFRTVYLSFIAMMAFGIAIPSEEIENPGVLMFCMRFFLLLMVASALFLTFKAASAVYNNKIEIEYSQKVSLVITMLVFNMMGGVAFVVFCKINDIDYRSL